MVDGSVFVRVVRVQVPLALTRARLEPGIQQLQLSFAPAPDGWMWSTTKLVGPTAFRGVNDIIARPPIGFHGRFSYYLGIRGLHPS
jgi:hypothetical protein